MTYIIKKTDGSLLLNLQDEKIDTSSVSVPLIGKNVSDYGEYYNNTIVSLVENFASTQQPNSPLIGQLWYDRSAGLMKVYGNSQQFVPIIPNIATSTVPYKSRAGDLWVDTTNKQLKFTTNGTDFMVAGPIYSSTQGVAGFQVLTVQDDGGHPHNVAAMYINGEIIAVLSNSTFQVGTSLDMTAAGITTITKGITSSYKFAGYATHADLADQTTTFTGQVALASIPPIFLTNYADNGSNNPINITTGTLSIANDSGLAVGANGNIKLNATGGVGSIISNIQHDIVDRPLRIQGKNTNASYFTAIYLDSANMRVGILNDTPAVEFDVSGDAIIRGNLTILGTSTFIESTNLKINDKNIELNYSASPTTDLIASGGGITLHGTTDHSLTWTNGTWNSSENFNLSLSTSSYKINGQDVLLSNRLGTAVTSAPGLVSIGVLDHLTVTNILLTGNTISTTNFDLDLKLNPNGTGAVDVSSSKIINLSTCTNPLDAANKQYVDSSLYQFTSRFSFSVDETNMIDPPTDILVILDKMFPVTNISPYDVLNIPNGARARILCSTLTINTPVIQTTSTRTVVSVDQGGIQNSVDVLRDINFSVPATVAISNTTYKVREYLVVTGVWTYVGIIT